MRKFELTITPDYCEDWTLVDAIRELFQNALDQKNLNLNSDIYFDYGDETLRIGNTNAQLEIQSLLFGASSKRGIDNAIGQFGEGYKIATLVLLRLGKGIKFYNYAKNEVWEPRFVNSRVYQKKILTFFINSIPNTHRTDLMVEITGISTDEYKGIVDSNLHLQEPEDVYESEYGSVLKSRRNAGKVFVSGLFVCNYPEYQYGYDFKPNYLTLGRDRKLVSDWDLQWLSSKMWKTCDKSCLPELTRLIEMESPDVKYYDSVVLYKGCYSYQGNEVELADAVYEQFKVEHGPYAVPVSSQTEIPKISEKYRPVIVKDLYKKLIQKATSFHMDDVYIPQEGLVSKFEKLFEAIKPKLDEEEIIRFENCMTKLREVSYKLDK